MKIIFTTIMVLAASISLHAVKLAGDTFHRGRVSTIVNSSAGPTGSNFGREATSWTADASAPEVTYAAGVSGAVFYDSSLGGISVPASATLNGMNDSAKLLSNRNTDSNVISRQFYSSMANTATQNMYVNFIYRYTTGALTGTDDFYFWLGNSDAPSSIMHLDAGFRNNRTADNGVRAPTDAHGYLLNNARAFNTDTSLTANNFIIIKLTNGAKSNYNHVQIFMDSTGFVPDKSGKGFTHTQNLSLDIRPTTLANLGFWINGLKNDDAIHVDNLQVGNNWQDVISPVSFRNDSTAGPAIIGIDSAWNLRRRRAKN